MGQYPLKGVVPHLKAIFSYFQNINFLKVQSIFDQNLFTELKNNAIKQFCQIFENYLQCRFLHFSYIKSIPKLARKCIKYKEIACVKPSSDCFHFILSNNIVCDDLLSIFKSLKGKLEFYCLYLMKKRIFDFKRRFLSFFNFVLFKFQNAISQEPCLQ